MAGGGGGALIFLRQHEIHILEIFLFKNMYLLYIKRCNFEYHMGGKISLKNLDLVSNFEIK